MFMLTLDTFFWYDLETFGLDPFYDRIAQFAGQRTDMNLNPIGEPIILYCKLSADYVPDPQSCLVTGITPQEVKEKGIPESEFAQQINEIFSEPYTCVCGFNSLKFDDEFIRNLFYRNFIDPYEREYKNHCSRWDIIDLVRATHDLRPNGINWPNTKENGNPTFKLTELTKANNIDQTGAHDAMVDVRATIAVAKLIKEKQPKLFSYYLRLRNKVVVKNLLNTQEEPKMLVYTSAQFTNPNGCTSVIVPITPHSNYENNVVCFDLRQDITPLLNATEENILKVPGLFKIAVNKVPFLASINAMSFEDSVRLGIDVNLCLERYKSILFNRPSLIKKIRLAPEDHYETINDPDYALYTTFFPNHDKELFSLILNTPPEKRLSLKLDFEDSRCPQLLWRHVCRSYPTLLDEENLKKWKSFASTRLLCPLGNEINDINFVERKIVEKLNDTSLSPKDKQVLVQLKDYIISLKKYLGMKI